MLDKYCWWHYPKKGLLASVALSFLVSITITFYAAPVLSFWIFNCLVPKPLAVTSEREPFDESEAKDFFDSFFKSHPRFRQTPYWYLYIYRLQLNQEASKFLLKDLDIVLDFSGPVLTWKVMESGYANGVENYALSKERERIFLPQEFVHMDSFGPGGFYQAIVLVGFPWQMGKIPPDVTFWATYTYQGFGLAGRAMIDSAGRQVRQ